MKKILITCVAYGDTYTNLFLNNHLTSLLDETNIPAFADRVEYIVFTDMASAKKIEAHPNWERLSKLIPTDIAEMCPPTHEARYNVLETQLQESIQIGLKGDYYVSAMVADLVVARGFISRIFSHLDSGFDSVFMLPLRSVAETIQLPKSGALDPMELCWRGYENLHPLWSACHWGVPQFTKLPYSLLWNTGLGILARSFSITPIVFTPYEEMKRCKMIDYDVPSLCKKPYWATDWIDAPVIGCEPIIAFYPPFQNACQNRIEWIGKGFAKQLHPSQSQWLSKKLFYPSAKHVAATPDVLKESDDVVKAIFHWSQ